MNYRPKYKKISKETKEITTPINTYDKAKSITTTLYYKLLVGGSKLYWLDIVVIGLNLFFLIWLAIMNVLNNEYVPVLIVHLFHFFVFGFSLHWVNRFYFASWYRHLLIFTMMLLSFLFLMFYIVQIFLSTGVDLFYEGSTNRTLIKPNIKVIATSSNASQVNFRIINILSFYFMILSGIYVIGSLIYYFYSLTNYNKDDDNQDMNIYLEIQEYKKTKELNYLQIPPKSRYKWRQVVSYMALFLTGACLAISLLGLIAFVNGNVPFTRNASPFLLLMIAGVTNIFPFKPTMPYKLFLPKNENVNEEVPILNSNIEKLKNVTKEQLEKTWLLFSTNKFFGELVKEEIDHYPEEAYLWKIGKLSTSWYLSFAITIIGEVLGWYSLIAEYAFRSDDNNLTFLACANTDYQNLINNGITVNYTDVSIQYATYPASDTSTAQDFQVITCANDILGIIVCGLGFILMICQFYMLFDNLSIQQNLKNQFNRIRDQKEENTYIKIKDNGLLISNKKLVLFLNEYVLTNKLVIKLKK